MPSSSAATTRSGCRAAGTSRGSSALPRAMPPMKLASSAAMESDEAPTISVTRWNQTSS